MILPIIISKEARIDSVDFHIFPYSLYRAGIQIGSYRMLRSQLQADDGQDTAAGSHIQKLRLRRSDTLRSWRIHSCVVSCIPVPKAVPGSI